MLIKLEGPPYIHVWYTGGDISNRKQRKLARATEKPELYTTGGFWATITVLVIAVIVIASCIRSLSLSGWLYYIPIALLCVTSAYVWNARIKPIMARRHLDTLVAKGRIFPEYSVAFEVFVRRSAGDLPSLGYQSTGVDFVLHCFRECERRTDDEYWFLQEDHVKAWDALKTLCDEWGVATVDQLEVIERRLSLSREAELKQALESARNEGDEIQRRLSLYRFNETGVGR